MWTPSRTGCRAAVTEPGLIKPRELAGPGEATWDMLTDARAGDVAALKGALERDPTLVGAGYWYMPPLHFAVREGHLDAVRLLVAAGADLTHRNALYGNDTLLQMAKSTAAMTGWPTTCAGN